IWAGPKAGTIRADAPARRHHDTAHSAVDPPRPAPAAGRVRAARSDPGWPVPPSGDRADLEGATLQALATEGLRGGDRALEPRARERDEEDAALRGAPRPDAGPGGDVAAHAAGAAGAHGDAGRAGPDRPRGDEPADAPPAREGPPGHAAPRPLVGEPGETRAGQAGGLS